MTHKKLSFVCFSLLLSATIALPVATAARQPKIPTQPISAKSIGIVSCITSTVEKNADGTLKTCVLAENKAVSEANTVCAANGPIVLGPEGKLTKCTLAVDRSFPEPFGITCDDGKPIEFDSNGTLAKCTAAAQKNIPAMGVACAANAEVEFYPGGNIKQCVNALEKKVPAVAAKEIKITEFTCAANSINQFYPNQKLLQCTPIDTIYMIGKGTCLGGETVTLHPDGKVQQCTYTFPLYQNRSCKIENKVSFHSNGNFKECILPDDKPAGKALCKADAPVSYRPNGTIDSCTLAAAFEQAPGKLIPAGTVVKIDEKQAVTIAGEPVKAITPASNPAHSAKPAAPAK